MQTGASAKPRHSVQSKGWMVTPEASSRIAPTGQMAMQTLHALQWGSILHAMPQSPLHSNGGVPLTANETLAQIPMFAGLDPEERATLATLAVERRYEAGAILFTEGMTCEGLYLIGAGVVKIVKTTSSGREIMLALEAAPATVAEVPVFDGGPYPASVAAVRDTVAYIIPKASLHRACREHPEIALKMLRVTGQRLRQLVMLLQAVTFGSVRQRVARQLMDWQAEHGEEFALPLSHEELAMRIGTVREVVSRNLSRFQAEGLIVIERRRVRVLDAAGLRSEAESEL